MKTKRNKFRRVTGIPVLAALAVVEWLFYQLSELADSLKNAANEAGNAVADWIEARPTQGDEKLP